MYNLKASTHTSANKATPPNQMMPRPLLLWGTNSFKPTHAPYVFLSESGNCREFVELGGQDDTNVSHVQISAQNKANSP